MLLTIQTVNEDAHTKPPPHLKFYALYLAHVVYILWQIYNEIVWPVEVFDCQIWKLASSVLLQLPHAMLTHPKTQSAQCQTAAAQVVNGGSNRPSAHNLLPQPTRALQMLIYDLPITSEEQC